MKLPLMNEDYNRKVQVVKNAVGTPPFKLLYNALEDRKGAQNTRKGEFTQYPFFVRFRPFFYVFASS